MPGNIGLPMDGNHKSGKRLIGSAKVRLRSETDVAVSVTFVPVVFGGAAGFSVAVQLYDVNTVAPVG